MKKLRIFVVVLIAVLIMGGILAVKYGYLQVPALKKGQIPVPQVAAPELAAPQVAMPAAPPAEETKPSESIEKGPAEEKVAVVVTPGDLSEAFINVADAVGPAVVSIKTERTQKIGGRKLYFSPFGENESPFQDEFFDKFFKDFFGDMPEREFKQMGMGSGVIIDKNGSVLTNEHVVGEADKITVVLPDGREFPAKLKGSDRRSDLAVLEIDASNLPVAELGDSDKVRTGEWVVAIGNPFGFAVGSTKPTVTVGVVSALHRSLPVGGTQERSYLDLIQTDAAINPGNSGGPLCDLNGKVVGINVAIYSTTGGYQGIGFAIPTNSARQIVDDLIKGKKILYGWLGVSAQEITQDMMDYFGLAEKKGAIVAGVVEGGPAEKAGVQKGDIIIALGNKEIAEVKDLLMAVGRMPVGETVELKVIREGKELVLPVKIGERPAEVAQVPVEKGEVKEKESWRGLVVSEITEQLAMRYRLAIKRGVVIVQVKFDSPAYNAGLREGVVIHEINRIPISNVGDYKKVTAVSKGNALIGTDRGYVILKEDK